MKKFQLFLITALLTAFAGQAWGQLGAAPKVYGTVYAYPTIGGGQVVITESKATPSDGDFKGDLPDTVNVNASNTTKTFYLHAKAFVGYEFLAWADDGSGKYGVSKDPDFEVSITTKDNSDDATKEIVQYYAIFRRTDLTKAGYYISNLNAGGFLNGVLTVAEHSGGSQIYLDSHLQDWNIENVPGDYKFSGATKATDISDIFNINFEQGGKQNNFHYGYIGSTIGGNSTYDHAFKFENDMYTPESAKSYADYRKYNCLLYQISEADIKAINNKTADKITATKISINEKGKTIKDILNADGDGYFFIAGNGEYKEFSIMSNIQWKQHFYDYYYKKSGKWQDDGKADPKDKFTHVLAGVRVKFANSDFKELNSATDPAPSTITIPSSFTVDAQNITLSEDYYSKNYNGSGQGSIIENVIKDLIATQYKGKDQLRFNIKDCIYKVSFAGDNKIQVFIGPYGISTYCSQYNLRIPEGCTVSGARRSIFDNVWRTDPVPAGMVLKAGVPFLIEGEPNSTVTFKIVDDTKYATVDPDSIVEEIEGSILKGTTYYEEVEAKDRYLLYNNTAEGVERAEFRLNNADHLLGPNKAYIEVGEFEDIPDLEPKGKLMLDLTNGGETGINKHRQSAKSGKMFTPWGTVAGKGYRGVVIMNGKKMFINK